MSTVTDTTMATRIGQLFFSTMSHNLYDIGLYRFVTGVIWNCPTERLLDNYADNISNNHLEVGVGSGYFLQRTLCTDFQQRLTLSDLNKRCLSKSAARLKAYEPATQRQNVLQPFPLPQRKYASVGMNYVLHCIPGGFRTNRRIFQHIHSVLLDDGVFFGATLVNRPAKAGMASWLFMRLLNALGIFNNQTHNVEELKAALDAVFSRVDVCMVGGAAVFVAVK